MHITLIGNYAHDRQESMQRFTRMLHNALIDTGLTVEVIRPEPLFGRLKPAATGLGKWFGYLDKFLLFPLQLRRYIARLKRLGVEFDIEGSSVVHICDHSNAHYTRYLADVPHVVTCHDLLAVRSAKGEVPENPTGWTGKQLQKLILGGLDRAACIVCVSEATRTDVVRLSKIGHEKVLVIPNGLNFSYSPMSQSEINSRLAKLVPELRCRSDSADGFSRNRYLLHVGGNQWYKNRLGVLKIYAGLALKKGAELPKLVLAGQPFTSEMEQFIADHPEWSGNVVPVIGPENEDLRALYSGAEFLLFPSMMEGFGWPIIEAQACGCRVITSGKAPMADIGGDAAIYIDPLNSHAGVEAACQLLDESADGRRLRIERGITNAQRFSVEDMIAKYIALYRDLASARVKVQPADK